MPTDTEAMMHIHTAVPVSIHLIVTVWAPEEVSPFHAYALALVVGEPLPQVSASRAILAGSMGIDLNRTHTLREDVLAGALVNFPAQLIGLLAVHAPGFARSPRLNLAQALKEQHAAGIPGTHIRDAAGDFVGGILMHAVHMPPELLVAVLAFDRLA